MDSISIPYINQQLYISTVLKTNHRRDIAVWYFKDAYLSFNEANEYKEGNLKHISDCTNQGVF